MSQGKLSGHAGTKKEEANCPCCEPLWALFFFLRSTKKIMRTACLIGVEGHRALFFHYRSVHVPYSRHARTHAEWTQITIMPLLPPLGRIESLRMRGFIWHAKSKGMPLIKENRKRMTSAWNPRASHGREIESTTDIQGPGMTPTMLLFSSN